MEIKVMTYNIHHGKGIYGKGTLKEIADTLEANGAEIVGLNEVDRSFSRRSGYVNQVQWLSDRLSMHYAFGSTLTRTNRRVSPGEYGNAILSRHPIVSNHNYLIGTNRSLIREKRALLEAEIAIGKNRIKAYVTHLSLNHKMKTAQIDLILQRLGSETLPVILMGDMNMKTGSASWCKVVEILNDASKTVPGSSYRTFPSLWPQVQLDYIFAGASFQIKSAEVVTMKRYASDHLPLQALLVLDV